MGWFYTITDEMIEWGLSGSELLVFALINGHSQRGQGCYWGSLENTSRVCGISRATAIRTLQSLVEKGFIRKNKAVIDEEFKTIYVATTVSKCDSKSQNDTERGIKMTPNNKRDIDISSIDIEDNSPKRFPFRKSLIEIGVSEEVADAWMSVRKKKRATNSEIAFNAIRREINLAGLTPDQAIRIAVEKSWSGFDHSWIEKERKVAPKKESVFEQNLRNLDTMFGTNYHEQAYGTKMNEYDEQ